MRFSLVLSTHPASFQAVALKGELAANLGKIAAWGYTGVELAIRDPALVDADELASLVEANHLVVPAIGTGQAWGEEGLSLTSSDPDIRIAGIRRLQSHIPLAARFHATIIIGLLRGITPARQSQAQSMLYLVEALQECTAAAAPLGVRFALEPLNRYETDLIHTVVQGLELIEQVGAPNLGLLLDTFHMNIEESSIEESIRLCSNRIFHFHVADSNRWYPSAGHLDFRSILAALSATGYQGYISGEFLPRPDPDTAALRSIEHLRKLDSP